MSDHVQNLVIGSGVGGYGAAVRLGQLHRETILVERETLGGVCLNVGCIPSKAIVRAAKLMKQIQRAQDFGIETSQPKMDLQKLQVWKKGVVDKLTKGVAYLCRGNKVDVVYGDTKSRSRAKKARKSSTRTISLSRQARAR
jgi:dihydrolipoamide dehydrogenase